MDRGPGARRVAAYRRGTRPVGASAGTRIALTGTARRRRRGQLEHTRRACGGASCQDWPQSSAHSAADRGAGRHGRLVELPAGVCHHRDAGHDLAREHGASPERPRGAAACDARHARVGVDSRRAVAVADAHARGRRPADAPSRGPHDAKRRVVSGGRFGRAAPRASRRRRRRAVHVQATGPSRRWWLPTGTQRETR